MHFRALCPSVMLASFHSGVVTSPFMVETAVELEEKTICVRDGSYCDPRESDEERTLAPSDTEEMEEDSDNDKENYNSRAGNRFVVRRDSVSRPIEIKRKDIDPVNTFRRTPGMGFSLFSRGILFASESTPKKSPPKSPSPPEPQLSSRLQLRISPPLSPLITPPEARICGGWPQKGSGMRRIPTTPISGRRSMRREHQQYGKLRSLPLRSAKSNMAMNPNQRFALVCRNDRFYWVSKEIEKYDRY